MKKEKPRVPENKTRRVDIDEACEYARIGKTTMYELLNQKKVRGYKSKRRLLIDLNSVDEYMATLPQYEPLEKGE